MLPFAEIDGNPPEIAGSGCDELLLRSSGAEGGPLQFDGLFLKFEGLWYALYFKSGKVIWRPRASAPRWANGRLLEDRHYAIDDSLCDGLGIRGVVLESLETEAVRGGVQVWFVFRGGVALLVNHVLSNSGRYITSYTTFDSMGRGSTFE